MRSSSLAIRNLTKTFNRRPVLRNISLEVEGPASVAITGRNGSGKSTLVKIVAGVLAPSSGSVAISVNGAVVPPEERYRHIGFVAPYLFLYDEFSARENLVLLETMRSGTRPDTRFLDDMFGRVGLADRQHDRLGTYSSGMKQRIKYIYALLHRPALLILDEPTSNLDDDGYDLVKSIVDEQRRDGVVIVATNESDEAEWCERKIEMKIG